MVSLHLLEGSKEDGRGEERCQHITDLVETYGRMSGSGKNAEEEQEEDDEEEDDDDDKSGEGAQEIGRSKVLFVKLLWCVFTRNIILSVRTYVCTCRSLPSSGGTVPGAVPGTPYQAFSRF